MNAWTFDEALVEVIRARLGAFGPLPLPAIAEPLALPAPQVQQALARLEREGYVLRGQFTPGTDARGMVRTASARADSSLHGQAPAPGNRAGGVAGFHALSCSTGSTSRPPRAVRAAQCCRRLSASSKVIAAAASAWDSDILPARLKDYSPSWLDDLCRNGKLVWTRLSARQKISGTALRSTPIVLLPRSQVGLWSALAEQTPVSELSRKPKRFLKP